ncbi:hypothetical protein TSAR_012358 [Trichomalopsis sarcophagae]|uniref:Uncharacterized protein n=1 Tax=Trichomalopsis sarcophagae TaxID=543379 RepID=A0A232F3V4_9HYME|nr:hypothetical protein TSAR_012358 [Trichomalopsis sarcophagae]
MTASGGARNRAIWIVLAIWLALLSATGAEKKNVQAVLLITQPASNESKTWTLPNVTSNHFEIHPYESFFLLQSQSNDHELRRRRPELDKSTQASALQSEAEELLEYGDELRSQILETLGKLVYDHYDELNLEQLETLYRVYRNTLERKYNIFETASSLRWRSGHLRASDICQAADGNVCACIGNSSQVCASLESLDKRRSAGGGGATDLAESVDKYFPEGLTLQALLGRLRKGDLRITPKLLVGLLRNVQYDSFDNTVRRIERIVIEHLETLRDSGLPYQLNDYSNIKSVASLLRTLLQGNAERFPAREKRAALMLADHVERDVNSISENIENFGSIYENRKINLKYLFELVVPDDLVDTDIVKARNRLEEVMDENDVPKKLSIEKYEHADPAQLMLEILRQMKYVSKTISFPKNAVKALRMHADFWRKGYTIDNVSDFLKLFSAYDNLMDHPNYTDFFDLIESIKEKLANSRNVDLELTCTMPRPCLRRVLLKILECNMIDDDTKKTVLKFLNMINSRGTPLLEEKQSKNFEDYTPFEVPEKYVDVTTEQSTVTTVTPDLDVPTETKTTAAYSTRSTPKHILKSPAEPLDKAKKSKPSSKRTPTNDRDAQTPKIAEEFPPEKADKNKIPVGNLKKKSPKKEIDSNERIKKKRKPNEPSTESETPIECEDGQECPADLESSTDRPKKSNRPIRKQLKPSNSRDVHKPKLPVNCEEGEECPSETDSPIDRPKTGNKQIKKHKPNQPLGTIESPIKCEEGQECSQKPKSFTDQPKPENKQVTRHRDTDESISETECVEGDSCPSKLDSLNKRPKTPNELAKSKHKPKKPQQDTERPELPRKCEEGQECRRDLVPPTDHQKAKNKRVKNKPKISKPRITEQTEPPVKCEEGEECPLELTEPTDHSISIDETTPIPISKTHRNINNSTPKPQKKRQKPNHDKSKKTRDKPKKKVIPANEDKTKQTPYSDTTISSMEDISIVQQIVTEGSTLSSIEHTTSDGEAVTKDILKDSTTNPPTAPVDGLHGYIEESTTNFPTESTESSQSSTNEYTTTESERSTKHPTDYLRETTITSTGDNTDDESFSENYTTIGARKNKINKKVLEESTTISPKIKQKSLKQPIEGKLHIRGNKQHRTETVEETTNPLTSDEDCKDSDDCNSERCKGSASCSEEGKTSERCSNSSDGSSEECTEKSCEGPDCSVTSPPSSSSSSVECENSSEEKCSTESADSCADGNCSTATTSAPRTTPLPPPVNSRENSTESCSDSDCSAPESCEGESCSNESNCDSTNCDSKSSSKCEGTNCSTTTESCEDEDCSSNSKITDLKTTPRVEHMRSTGAICDSADCLEETNEDCQGPDCEPTQQTISLNCESGDCTSPQKSACTGPNCPSRKSKICNGDDCSQNCEGGECLNTNENVTRTPITESPATFKRTLSPKQLNNENDKPKLCSTKDPHRKRKNERLQRVRQLSNSVPEEQISSIQDNELPLDKVNVRRSQSRKRVEEYIKPQLGPLLKGLTKAAEINKLNKNIRNQRQFRRDKTLQTSQVSVNKQLNHSYPYPAGLHTSLNTDSDLNLNAHRRSNNLQNQGKKSNNFGKISRGQEYTIKPRQRNNNLNNSKISKIDHQYSARNNQRKQQTVGKSFDYFEYTSPPQLYQNRQKLFSKTKPVTI